MQYKHRGLDLQEIVNKKVS